MNPEESYADWLGTNGRRGWCGVCGEVPITNRPSGHDRMWFCARCGHFLGTEPNRPPRYRREARRSLVVALSAVG